MRAPWRNTGRRLRPLPQPELEAPAEWWAVDPIPVRPTVGRSAGCEPGRQRAGAEPRTHVPTYPRTHVLTYPRTHASKRMRRGRVLQPPLAPICMCATPGATDAVCVWRFGGCFAGTARECLTLLVVLYAIFVAVHLNASCSIIFCFECFYWCPVCRLLLLLPLLEPLVAANFLQPS